MSCCHHHHRLCGDDGALAKSQTAIKVVPPCRRAASATIASIRPIQDLPPTSSGVVQPISGVATGDWVGCADLCALVATAKGRWHGDSGE